MDFVESKSKDFFIVKKKSHRSRTKTVVFKFSKNVFMFFRNILSIQFTTKNRPFDFLQRFFVVNCFQNCILAYNSQHESFTENIIEVVNCFQNCILAYNSQHFVWYIICTTSCELLSKLYFSL